MPECFSMLAVEIVVLTCRLGNEVEKNDAHNTGRYIHVSNDELVSTTIITNQNTSTLTYLLEFPTQILR